MILFENEVSITETFRCDKNPWRT